MMASPRLLALWSAPRSRSTAFFRMMAERGDFRVVHEPFSYLAEFGESEIDGTYARTEEELLAALRSLSRRTPVFLKDTSDERYPGLVADEAFLARDAWHAFIIRDPRQTIASYYKLNPDVALRQIGFEYLYEIFVRVREMTGETPFVLDGDDLVRDPEAVIRAYCDQMGVPFVPGALAWKAGDRAEWGPTRRWHTGAGASRGFHRSSNDYTVSVDDDPVLGRYLRQHRPFYEELRSHRVTV